MWETILSDYSPSDHPSHIACAPSDGNKPPPAILGTIEHKNCLICSTIFRFAVAHCFDADYSDRFRPTANDTTICPCDRIPRPNPTRRPCHARHTRAHVIFHCPITQPQRLIHLYRLTSLHQIFRSKDDTLRLCAFLRDTSSTLLRPLPILRPGHDPP
jgi:hypothetical protein